MTRSMVQVHLAPPIANENLRQGDVAQLARAPALQAGGPGFESPHLHHITAVDLRKSRTTSIILGDFKHLNFLPRQLIVLAKKLKSTVVLHHIHYLPRSNRLEDIGFLFLI